MILKVNKDSCEIKENEVWNVGDYNVHTVNVELSSDFNGLVNKVRYFVEDNCYDELIVNNIAQVPYEATLTEGTIKIGVYGFDADTNILVQSTSPVNKFITSGTYTGDPDNTQPLTPTDKQQMESAIQKNTDDIIDLQNNKQDVLISGENIKTINSESILGNGNIEIDVGSINYNDLENKPKINNVELVGNKSLNDLGIQPVGNYALESEIPDVSNFITKDVNNLTNYTLKTNTGSLIDLEINDTTYIVTLKLKNLDGTIISADTIDLPLESVVVSGRYDNTTKKVILTLENGSEVDFSVADLVAGLQAEITSSNKLASDLVDDTNSGNKFVTTGEKQTWNNKYDKPNGGIPKTDLASTVQTSLNKADTAIQEHQDISGKEDKTNKVTSIDNTSTDTQYPSAKCVHDSQATQDDEIEALQTENERLKATLPTTTGEGQDITLDKTAEMEFVKPPLPRGNTKQNTTTGKNLLNTSNANTTTLNGVTSYRSKGFYYLSGTNTKTDATWILPNTQNTNLPTFEIGQTYTMSVKGTLPNGVYAQLNGVKTSTGSQYSIGSVRRTVPSLTFTIDSDYSSTAQLFIGIQGETTNADCNFAIQIEKGPTATSYEPYTGGIPSPNPDYPQEIRNVTGNVEVTISNENNTESKTLPVSLGNIELCKIGDYQDYFYKESNKWYLHKEINKLVLNGSEDWVTGSVGTNSYLLRIIGIKYPPSANDTGLFIKSSHFRGIPITSRLTSGNNLIYVEPSPFINIRNTPFTSISDFKTWLSTHNTIVYYVLATPTDTEITDTTLISQLEEISKTLSYQGQTNITSNTIALFDVEAYQSTKLILENLDSRLTLVEG